MSKISILISARAKALHLFLILKKYELSCKLEETSDLVPDIVKGIILLTALEALKSSILLRFKAHECKCCRDKSRLQS